VVERLRLTTALFVGEVSAVIFTVTLPWRVDTGARVTLELSRRTCYVHVQHTTTTTVYYYYYYNTQSLCHSSHTDH